MYQAFSTACHDRWRYGDVRTRRKSPQRTRAGPRSWTYPEWSRPSPRRRWVRSRECSSDEAPFHPSEPAMRRCGRAAQSLRRGCAIAPRAVIRLQNLTPPFSDNSTSCRADRRSDPTPRTPEERSCAELSVPGLPNRPQLHHRKTSPGCFFLGARWFHRRAFRASCDWIGCAPTAYARRNKRRSP